MLQIQCVIHVNTNVGNVVIVEFITLHSFIQSSENGAVLNSWEGVRLHAIATHPCNDLVYAADSHMRIKQYNFHDKISVTL